MVGAVHLPPWPRAADDASLEATTSAKRPRLSAPADPEEDAISLLALLTSDESDELPAEEEEDSGTCSYVPRLARSGSSTDASEGTSSTSPLPSPMDETAAAAAPGVCPPVVERPAGTSWTQLLNDAVWMGDVAAVAACLRRAAAADAEDGGGGACIRASSSRSKEAAIAAAPSAAASSCASSSSAAADGVLRDDDEWPLLAAAAAGHLEIAHLLLTVGKSPVDEPHDSSRGGGEGAAAWDWQHACVTPLHLAASRADVTMVALLLRHGANPYRIDASGERAVEKSSAAAVDGGADGADDDADDHASRSLRALECAQMLRDAMDAMDDAEEPRAQCGCEWHTKTIRAVEPVMGAADTRARLGPKRRGHACVAACAGKVVVGFGKRGR